jgi:hypothetical protein
LPPVAARSLRQTAGHIALAQGLSPTGLTEMLGVNSRSIARYFQGSRRMEEHGSNRVLRHVKLLEQEDELLAEASRLLADQDVLPLAPLVLIGAALERHLRVMCQSVGRFTDELGSLDRYKGVLKSEGVISNAEVKQIDRWRDLRNAAAHGRTDVSRHDALDMKRGVTEFIGTHL